jgi:phosphomethylpyrimidine synthase
LNADPKFLSASAIVDAAAVEPLPNSRKVYVAGSRPDIRVPMREIQQSPTPASFGAEPNPPVWVYDTSGPYTDPDARIDIRAGLDALRAGWIRERADTEELPGPSSHYGIERLNDPKLAELRFQLTRTPRRAGREHAVAVGGAVRGQQAVVVVMAQRADAGAGLARQRADRQRRG